MQMDTATALTSAALQVQDVGQGCAQIQPCIPEAYGLSQRSFHPDAARRVIPRIPKSFTKLGRFFRQHNHSQEVFMYQIIQAQRFHSMLDILWTSFYHIFIILLAIGIAFSLPNAAVYVLYDW